ncbi:AAA family ATPase [[Clostridium] colinum]|uniref:AAA family ATPase n=1 Tax=[Clostridium] colinum TaxID=36835 RepID=UPI0020248B90|nr:AAA family ATPase [[Clostridium] colinum]
MNREQIVKKITEILKGGATQVSIAKAIGTNETYISKYLKGNFEGDIEKLETNLIKYIHKFEISKPTREFIKTKDATCILGICNSCQKLEQLGLVYGRSGFGKTTTLRKYADSTEKVIYIVCNSFMNANDIIKRISVSLGLKGLVGSKDERIAKIKEFFKYNKGYLLIFDEADKLLNKDTISKLDVIKTIYDEVDGDGVGVILAGEQHLKTKLGLYFEMVRNRGDLEWELKGLSRLEVETYLQGVKLTPKALEELVMRATNDNNGCFRTLNRTFKNVQRLFEDKNKNIETEEIGLEDIKSACILMPK